MNKIFDVPYIRGVSTVVPKKRVILEELAPDFNISDIALKNIMNLSGIREVRQTTEDETISDLCISAAEHLLDELNFDKALIDGIVFVTPAPDYLMPGPGNLVHAALNLSKNCLIFDISQGCAGYTNGLFQAFLMVQSGYCKNVLLCSGDTPTKFVHPKDKSMRMVHGDAGTATLISAGKNSARSAFTFYSDGEGFKLLYIPAGGCKIPKKTGITDIETVDEQGNTRTLENVYMNGLEVMAFAVNVVPKKVQETLNLIGWNKDEVDLFVFHQANKFMLNSLRKRLKLPPEKVVIQVEKYGNVGCGAIPLALCEENFPIRRQLEKVIFCTFGGGLACITAALNLEETHFCKLREFQGN